MTDDSPSHNRAAGNLDAMTTAQENPATSATAVSASSNIVAEKPTTTTLWNILSFHRPDGSIGYLGNELDAGEFRSKTVVWDGERPIGVIGLELMLDDWAIDLSNPPADLDWTGFNPARRG